MKKHKMLRDEIIKIIETNICDTEKTRERYLKRLKKGLLTRDENLESHFCAYFFPYNPKTQKVFVVHHKKADLWLSPGGHIDKDETLWETLNREIREELGVPNFFKKSPSPLLCTITPIEHDRTPCKTHFDIWFIMKTDGNDFQIDPREFHDTKWCTVEEAKKIVTDPANKKALALIQQNFTK